jgi:hypothetical protein
MHNQTDHPGHEPPAGLPVIRGPRWFDTENRPFVLRIECPLAFEEMVAALYWAAEAGDLASDEDLCGCIAVALSIEGLAALQERARKIRLNEHRGAIESPAFLALCRQRIAALTGR